MNSLIIQIDWTLMLAILLVRELKSLRRANRGRTLKKN